VIDRRKGKGGIKSWENIQQKEVKWRGNGIRRESFIPGKTPPGSVLPLIPVFKGEE